MKIVCSPIAKTANMVSGIVIIKFTRRLILIYRIIFIKLEFVAEDVDSFIEFHSYIGEPRCYYLTLR